MPQSITFSNPNLTLAQINAFEHMLNMQELTELTQKIDLRVLSGFLHNDMLVFNSDTQSYTITPYGIQSYCASVLSKVGGNSHDRIYDALTKYRKLFPS